MQDQAVALRQNWLASDNRRNADGRCFGLDPQRLTFNHAGLDEKLVGVGPPAEIVSGLLA